MAVRRKILMATALVGAVPVALEEAARLDGANRVQLLRHGVFPGLRPVTATVIILTAVYVWNEFALSSYIMSDQEMRTLAPSIAAFFGQQGSDINAGGRREVALVFAATPGPVVVRVCTVAPAAVHTVRRGGVDGASRSHVSHDHARNLDVRRHQRSEGGGRAVR